MGYLSDWRNQQKRKVILNTIVNYKTQVKRKLCLEKVTIFKHRKFLALDISLGLTHSLFLSSIYRHEFKVDEMFMLEHETE